MNQELREVIVKVHKAIVSEPPLPYLPLPLAEAADFLGLHESVLLDLVSRADLKVDCETMSFRPRALQYIRWNLSLKRCQLQHLAILCGAYDEYADAADTEYIEIKNTLFKLSPTWSFAYSTGKAIEYSTITLPCFLSTRYT